MCWLMNILLSEIANAISKSYAGAIETRESMSFAHGQITGIHCAGNLHTPPHYWRVPLVWMCLDMRIL